MPSTLNSELTLPCGAVLPNRLAKAAMTEGLADDRDHATQSLANLYQTWSKGGCGLLITGNVMVDHRFLERPGNVVLEDESGMAALRRWAAAGTAAGNHLWMQISHPGRQCSRLVSSQPLSPSDVQLKMLGNFARPRAMTGAEIETAIEGYARTAALAKEAGFTGVQIHAAHGYLISQFLSPVTNRRGDQWGGSLENRSRFLMRTVAAVRERVGADFPVGVKLNSADFQRGGFSLDDSAQVAAWLSEAGIDLLEISGGTYEQLRLLGHGDDHSQDRDVRESTRRREAYFLDYARRIRQACTVPLMVTGGFRSRLTMEEAVAGGEIEVVGLARPLCGEPGIARYLLRRQVDYAPAYERDLKLGSGLLGPASPIPLIKVINVQGEVAWFYHQILQLSRQKSPELGLTVLPAFLRHMAREYRIGLRRRWRLRRDQS
ncbi:MAG: NADH:flavin oxidoreductase/NADH oxidase family protein [Pseudomonadota bacterium]